MTDGHTDGQAMLFLSADINTLVAHCGRPKKTKYSEIEHTTNKGNFIRAFHIQPTKSLSIVCGTFVDCCKVAVIVYRPIEQNIVLDVAKGFDLVCCHGKTS
jgi:hypothetical protein